MKTPQNVIDAFYALVPVTPATGFVRWYKYSYPDDIADACFGIINTLGVPADSIQEVEVNVNCYAKDLSIQKGIPDLSKLNEMAGKVITELHDYNNDVFDIEYQTGAILREKDLNCHFFNLRFKLIFINN